MMKTRLSPNNPCRVFNALADPIRLSIVERLIDKGLLTAGEIARPYNVSLPAISRHLSVLERAGLIERKIDRQWRVFCARSEGIAVASCWFERHRQFWEGSLDRLDRLLLDTEDGNDNHD